MPTVDGPVCSLCARRPAEVLERGVSRLRKARGTDQDEDEDKDDD